MAFQHLTTPIPELEVEIAQGNKFSVRGLTPANVLALYNRHAPALELFFAKMAERYKDAGEVDSDDVMAFVLGILNEAPVLMAELLALAAGSDPDNHEVWMDDVIIASSFPFPVQVSAIQKIGQLTFTSEMPPGKFLAVVLAMLQPATATDPAA